jgi:SAM-dependent methyltransferase
MGSPIRATGARLCLACGAAEPIARDAPLWPVGWRCAACGNVVPVAHGIPQYAPSLANSLTGFDPAVFDQLASREEGHFWFEPRNRLLVGLAKHFFPEAQNYLEIGCGTGVVLAAMAASRQWSRLAGAEIHPAGLTHARRRLANRAEFVQMDARNIPARVAFDLVGAFDVLEHIAEDEAVMREVYAALVPGGGILAAVPQHPALWSWTDDIGHHVRRYRRGELERKLRDAGFEILFSTSYVSLLLPLMLASRLVSWGHAREDLREFARREFDIPRTLNAVLRWVLEAEVKMTLKGVSWPVGGSRVVVASRPPISDII